MDNAIQTANTLNYTLLTEDPKKLLDCIKQSKSTVEDLSYNHAWTSSASTASQVIAMTVFVEGKSGIKLLKFSNIMMLSVRWS